MAENSNSSTVPFSINREQVGISFLKITGAVLYVGENTPRTATFIFIKDPIKFSTLSLSLNHVKPDVHICLRLNPAVLIFRSIQVVTILNAFHYSYVICHWWRVVIFWAIFLKTTNPVGKGILTQWGEIGSFQIVPQYISLRTVLCDVLI